MAATRVGVRGPPRSSCSAPCNRSFSARAAINSSSNALCAGLGPGNTANRLRPPSAGYPLCRGEGTGLVRLAAIPSHCAHRACKDGELARRSPSAASAWRTARPGTAPLPGPPDAPPRSRRVPQEAIDHGLDSAAPAPAAPRTPVGSRPARHDDLGDRLLRTRGFLGRHLLLDSLAIHSQTDQLVIVPNSITAVTRGRDRGPDLTASSSARA